MVRLLRVTHYTSKSIQCVDHLINLPVKIGVTHKYVDTIMIHYLKTPSLIAIQT